jgi:STE24 endopeptidase
METSGSSPPTDADRADQPMTPEQLAEAKEYGRRELACDLADRAVDVAYLAALAVAGARPLDRLLQQWECFQPMWSRLIAFFVVMTLGHVLVSLPLSYYSGHVLEHRYGLSRQSLGGWLRRYCKRNLLALAFGIVLTQGLFWTIWLTGPWWWLVAAGVFFLLSAVLGQLAPVLILPLFYRIERLADDRLSERFQRMAEGTGLSIEGVYRMEMSAETAKANAMLAGLGRTRRVILADTLLDRFSAEELEVIFAHEVGHHVHGHIHKMILLMLVYSAASFFACDRVLAGVHAALGLDWDYATLPVYVLPSLMLVITLISMVLEPLQNAVSRHFERQSDRYALDRTSAPAAFQSAFHKLARINKADPDPHPLEVFLFHSHPPIQQRLAIAGDGCSSPRA